MKKGLMFYYVVDCYKDKVIRMDPKDEELARKRFSKVVGPFEKSKEAYELLQSN